jgi:cytosine/adenosine deaminase-related metal-dependent hydrolase
MLALTTVHRIRYGPAIQHFTPDDLQIGYLAGAFELLYEGTTTVLDHAHASWSDETVDACVNATFESGIRSFYAHAIHTLPNNYSWDAQVLKLQSLARDPRFAQSDSESLVSLGLAYDFFYNAPEANITQLWNITKEGNLSVVTTHFLGGPFSDTNSPTALQSFGWL